MANSSLFHCFEGSNYENIQLNNILYTQLEGNHDASLK